MALAVIFTLWYKRNPILDRGLTFNSHNLKYLLIVGVAAWAFGDLGNKIIWILDAEYNIGTSVPWREALLNADKTPGWWLLMAVGSFGLVPLLEELFWRGYVQSRLMENYSPVVAIVITAVFFVFSHTQYHQFDLYHGATIISLLFTGLVLGWIYHITGSLIPSIIMHAILNFPTEGLWMYVVFAIMTIGVAVFNRVYKKQLLQFYQHLSIEHWSVMEIIAVVFASLMMLGLSQKPGLMMNIGYSAMGISVLLAINYKIKFRKMIQHSDV